MTDPKPTFASIAPAVKPRGILKDHAEEKPTKPAAPKKRGAGQGKPAAERATEKQTLYFTTTELDFIKDQAGLVKIAPHLRHVLHELGYFKGMKR